MRHFPACSLSLSLLLLVALAPPTWAEEAAEGRHVLEGRIIRSLALDADDANHILVGLKVKTAGVPLVLRSLDGGKKWSALNGGKPLNPKATDVQAVLPVSSKVVLAGTWKHGLYRSGDGGSSFDRVEEFPSADVRDLQVSGNVIYAATGSHGVFQSEDEGETWKSIGPGRDFLWSITVAGERLFASSPTKAVYERPEIGSEWLKTLQMTGASAIAVTPGSGGLMAIAGGSGVSVLSQDGWQRVLKGEKFADVVITRNNRIIAGSWSNGIAVLTLDGQLQERLLKGVPVIHVQVAGRQLLAGTWGNGLHVFPLHRILTRSADDAPLLTAVLCDDLVEVRRLIESGAEIDAHDEARNTALTLAARDGQVEFAKELIKAGADRGWIDSHGATPLILAVQGNHLQTVKVLLAKRSKLRVSHTDKAGHAAKDYAERRGTEDAIYKLLAQ